MGHEHKTLNSDPVRQIEETVRLALFSETAAQPSQWLLAVSGGMDSMVLLEAAASVARSLHAENRLAVATFNHGTGPAASAAAEYVSVRSAELGLACTVGIAKSTGRTEAEWRKARWDFLNSVSEASQSSVVTAHTHNDQIETVFMRILRNAGPRGLAALYSDSSIVRPLIRTTREVISQYAADRKITFVSDPSNLSRQHLRNRIRHDLLPAITAARPNFDAELQQIADKAADWRTRMDQIAANFTLMTDATGSIFIPRGPLASYSPTELQVLWPSLVARAGIVLDRRGTQRLAMFTIEGESGQSIQLSGAIHVRLRRDSLVFTRPTASRNPSACNSAPVECTDA